MPYFFYGYDPYYWMILVPAMLIALFAQLKVSSTFNRYDRVRSARGYTGAPGGRGGAGGSTASPMCALSGSEEG